MTRVKLVWDKACATRYSIEASADAVVWKQIYATRSGNGEVDEIVVAGVGRYIQVVGKSRCLQDGGYSLREFEVYGTVDRGTDKQAPPPPSDLTASDVTSSSLTLSWTASKDDGVLAGYDVANNGNLLRTARPSSTSVTLTGLAPNTRYRLTVVARDGAGNSSRPSNVVAFTTLPGADNRPPVWVSPIRATSITTKSVTLEWDPAQDDDEALRYDVYRDGPKVATVADTGMVVTGLKPGTRYRFYVKARDTAGNNSLASNEVVVKTKADRPEIDWGAEIVRSTMERRTPSQMGGWNYRTGLYLYGQYLVYKRTGDRAQLGFVTSWVDRFVDSEGNLQPRIEHLDAMLSGRLLLALYRETGANRYRMAATKIRDRLNTYPRTSDGGFWHAAGVVKSGELWADGVFMSLPFLAEYGRDVGDQKYAWDEVTKQLLIYASHLQMENGLLRHAYSEARDLPWSDRATGVAPEHWCRAVGWFGMATSAPTWGTMPTTSTAPVPPTTFTASAPSSSCTSSCGGSRGVAPGVSTPTSNKRHARCAVVHNRA